MLWSLYRTSSFHWQSEKKDRTQDWLPDLQDLRSISRARPRPESPETFDFSEQEYENGYEEVQEIEAEIPEGDNYTDYEDYDEEKTSEE